MSDLIESTFYMTVSLKNRRYWNEGLALPKLTVKQPTIPKGAIALKLKVAVPKALFTEFIPEGTIVLPEDASIGRPAIEVHVPEGVEITPDIRLALVPWPPEEE